jgi:hypothetical protein
MRFPKLSQEFRVPPTVANEAEPSPIEELSERPDSPADDLLVGASKISMFLFGTVGKRRAVYHLAEKGVLPGFKWGGQLVARKSTLLTFIADRERTALANLAPE